ncbi:hypothetical protein Avbf_05376 [Armadillidium vulgare]|nr:hypothetical protein Avbf_05376 [Armadillidium vulgare]
MNPHLEFLKVLPFIHGSSFAFIKVLPFVCSSSFAGTHKLGLRQLICAIETSPSQQPPVVHLRTVKLPTISLTVSAGIKPSGISLGALSDCSTKLGLVATMAKYSSIGISGIDSDIKEIYSILNFINQETQSLPDYC